MANRNKHLPSSEKIELELKRLNRRKEYIKTLMSTIYSLIIVAAIAILTSSLYLSVLVVQGESMAPTLNEGDILIGIQTSKFQSGEIVAFYYDNKVLLKRVIATAGDWVDIDADGTVQINGEVLTETYIQEKSLGEIDIALPYQVPENRIFVLGDHRETSIDSRLAQIGAVAKEQVVGKVLFRIWPLNKIGLVK